MERANAASDGDLRAAARIRNAAVARFAGQGFDATSLREVAADAGVTHGLVRHHFGGKEGLREAADREVLARLRPAFHTPTDDPTAIFEHRRRGFSYLAVRDPVVLDYLARILTDRSPAGAAFFRQLIDGFRSHLGAMEEAGILRPTDDPDVRAGLVAVSALGMWVLRPLLEEALGLSLTDPDDLTRWLDGERALMTTGLFEPTEPARPTEEPT